MRISIAARTGKILESDSISNKTVVGSVQACFDIVYLYCTFWATLGAIKSLNEHKDCLLN